MLKALLIKLGEYLAMQPETALNLKKQNGAASLQLAKGLMRIESFKGKGSLVAV